MGDLLKRVILAGIGALSLTRETVEKLLDELAKRGEIAYEEKEGLLRELIKVGKKQREEIEKGIERGIEKFISRTNIATREDIEKVEERLERLEKKITSS